MFTNMIGSEMPILQGFLGSMANAGERARTSVTFSRATSSRRSSASKIKRSTRKPPNKSAPLISTWRLQRTAMSSTPFGAPGAVTRCADTALATGGCSACFPHRKGGVPKTSRLALRVWWAPLLRRTGRSCVLDFDAGECRRGHRAAAPQWAGSHPHRRLWDFLKKSPRDSDPARSVWPTTPIPSSNSSFGDQ